MKPETTYRKFCSVYSGCFFINKTKKVIKIQPDIFLGSIYLPFIFEGYKIIYINEQVWRKQ